MNVGVLEAILRLKDQNFTSGLAKAQGTMQRMRRAAVQHVGAAIKVVAAMGTTIIGLGTAALKMGTDFNRGMANVATLIPGNSARVKELSRNVQDMARATGIATSDLTEGLYQTVSAFGDSADTAEILNIAARSATAGVSTTTEATDLLSAVTKGYGDTSAGAVQKAADLSLMTVRLGQTDFPQLAGSMGRVISIAESMGQTQEELFAVFATATGVTGTASEVASQYRGVLASLLNPTAEMTTLIERSGFASGKAMLEQKGLVGTLQGIVAAAEDSGEPITKYISQIEAVPLALALAGPQADVFADKLFELERAAGAVDVAFAEQTEGINALGFQWSQFKQELVTFGQEAGQALMPIASEILSWVRSMIADQGGVEGLAEKFRSSLPKAIAITLDAFVLVSRAGTGMWMAWRSAITGIAHLWDLLVAAINSGAATVVRAYNLIITAMRAVREETLGEQIAMDLLQTSLNNLADDLDSTANQSLANIRARSADWSAEMENALDRQRGLEAGVESFKASLVGAVTVTEEITEATNAYTDSIYNYTTAKAAAWRTQFEFQESQKRATQAIAFGVPTLYEYTDAMVASWDAQEDLNAAQRANITTTNDQAGAFGNLFGELFNGIPILGDLASSFDNFLGGLFGGGGGGGKFDIGNILGGILGGIGGEGEFGKVFSSILGTVMGPLGGLISAGISQIGGMLIDGIKSLFKSTAEFRSERQGGIFGAFNVPQGVLDSLGELSAGFTKAGRALPDTIASIVGFDDVLRAVGIDTMQQFMFAMGKGDETVQRFREGLITGAEAAEFFGSDALAIMRDAAIELGGTAEAEFQHMIDKAIEAGIRIPEEFAGAMADVEATTSQAAREIGNSFDPMLAGWRDTLDEMREEAEDFDHDMIGGSLFRDLTRRISEHIRKGEISEAWRADMERSTLIAERMAKRGIMADGGGFVPPGIGLALEPDGGFRIPGGRFDNGGHTPRVPRGGGGGGRGGGGRVVVENRVYLGERGEKLLAKAVAKHLPKALRDAGIAD